MARVTRRMTRSQSREIEPPSHQIAGDVKSSRSHTKRRNANAPPLATVAEATPKSSVEHSSVIPESPEENLEGDTNISGTTFFGQQDAASDDEEESESLDLTAEDVLDELPDLKPAAAMIMDLLITDHADERGIVNEARRLRSADRSEKRRIEKHRARLVERMRNFTTEIFIDVEHIRNLVPPFVSEDSSQEWSPSPTLFSANCARLAHSLLLSTGDSQFDQEVIKTLNFQFPAPFLDNISSGFEKATFDLALDIRTQYFVMEFERLQGTKDFDPDALIQSVFYDTSLHEGTELDSRWLRGFALQSYFLDENRCLPERFHNDVLERIDSITDAMIDDDEAVSLTDLKAAFPWKPLYRRAAHFLRRRDIEINQEFGVQVDIGDVRRALRRHITGQNGTPSSARGPLSVQSRRYSSFTPTTSGAQRTTQTPSRQQTPTRQVTTIASTRRDVLQQSPVQAESSFVRPAPSATDESLVAQSAPTNSSQSSGSNPTMNGAQRATRTPSAQETPTREVTTITSTRHDVLHQSPVRERPSSVSPAPSATDKSPVAQPASTNNGQNPITSVLKKRLSKGFRDPSSIKRVKDRQTRLSIQSVAEPPTAASTTHESTAGNSFGDTTLVPDNEDDETFVVSNEGDAPIDFDETDASTTPARSARTPQPSHNLGESPTSPVRRNQTLPRVQQTPQRYIDRQNTAARVSPINEAESQSAERPSTHSNPNTKKRAHGDMSPDPEDDFEENTREINVEERRATMPQASRRVRQRIEQPEDEGATNSRPATSQPENRATSSDKPPPSTEPAAQPTPTVTVAVPNPRSSAQPDQPPAPKSAWKTRNTPGSKNAGYSGTKGGRWTTAEDKRLEDLLKVHGPRWAIILQEDKNCRAQDGGPQFVERQRDQMGLRARARLLRYHKERDNPGKPLPSHFEGIPPPTWVSRIKK